MLRMCVHSMIYHSYFQSPVGLLHLESDGSSLTGLHFTAAATYAAAELPVFADTAAWLDAYLFGDPERTRTVDLQRDRLAC